MPQLWLTSAAGGPGLGRVSRPWGGPMVPLLPRASPHIPLALSRCHGAVAMAPLPGNHCQGTAFISHQGRQQRGPITPTPHRSWQAGWGFGAAWDPPLPPPQHLVPAGRGWGCRGGPFSAPLDGSEPPGQGVSRLRDCREGHPACFAVSPWARKIPGV